ncbi:MAG: hypothetical protein IPM69_10845 [Ignavibacteria bacterium]|nr:hypothetical protein [Ignavibacteria bacterium]
MVLAQARKSLSANFMGPTEVVIRLNPADMDALESRKSRLD